MSDRSLNIVELWCSIPEYIGLYEISNYGNVRSYYISRANYNKRRFSTTPNIIKGSIAKNGYKKVTLHKDGCKTVSKWVHRLVLEAFVGSCPKNLEEAAHLNGDPTDNCITNLKWVTRKENMAHKLLHGTHNRGERCGTSKLKEKEVIEIRKLYKNGSLQKELALLYGVQQATISKIVNKKHWNILKGEI